MSNFYNPRRTRNVFNPESKEPFRVSRSKIELFLNCPRCFYFDCRCGVGRPKGYPFNLNTAVDTLLKKEFDFHRANKTAHKYMQENGIDAVPFVHEKIDQWRTNFIGVQYLHKKTNLLIFGAVDDIWQKSNGELIVVDYKATSKKEEVSLDADWQIIYKRQMETYQWLLRRNGFKVSDVGYFIYCNGDTDKEAFDGKIEFDVKVIPYKGNTNWLEKTIHSLFECLIDDSPPEVGKECDYCKYIATIKEKEKEFENQLIMDAKKFVAKKGKCTTLALQKEFKIGYPKAARLKDILEKRNVCQYVE
mgnify:CR=1 FL=1